MKYFPLLYYKYYMCFLVSAMLFVLHTSPVFASLGALENIFNSLGSQTNVSTPGSFHDQAAGYYTAGGLYMRNRSTTLQPIQVSLPHLGAGCNGLDLYMGAFSFMKGEQLVQMLRSLGTQAVTYGMQLALKTMSPQIENLLSQLRKNVMDMNGMMLNSCEAAQQVMGGLWPANTTASEQICQDMSRQGGEDWFGARKHCEKPQKVQDNVDRSKQVNKDLIQGEYNLTWYIVKEKLGYDSDLAKFLLTTVGTVISRKENTTYRITFVEGQADDSQFIEAYLKGGKAKERFCKDNETKCLDVGIKDSMIADKDSMTRKVMEKIHFFRETYIEAKPMTDQDKMFLNDTAGLPLYRYVEVSVASRSEFLLLDACEYLAHQVLIIRFDKASKEILNALDQIKSIQLDDKIISAFQDKIQGIRGRLLTLKTASQSHTVKYLNDVIQAHEHAVTTRETY